MYLSIPQCGSGRPLSDPLKLEDSINKYYLRKFYMN